MAWEHKGIAISLDGASFVGEVNGKRFRSSSLVAAKKAIDKQLEAKAQEVSLRMNLVRISESGKVNHFVLIGIDPITLEPQWDGENPSRYGGSFYPDDKESLRVHQECEKAEEAFEKAKDVRNARIVSLYFHNDRRHKVTYAQAVEQVQKRYEDAKKGKAE